MGFGARSVIDLKPPPPSAQTGAPPVVVAMSSSGGVEVVRGDRRRGPIGSDDIELAAALIVGVDAVEDPELRSKAS
jgi:hypothetical protein